MKLRKFRHHACARHSSSANVNALALLRVCLYPPSAYHSLPRRKWLVYSSPSAVSVNTVENRCSNIDDFLKAKVMKLVEIFLVCWSSLVQASVAQGIIV